MIFTRLRARLRREQGHTLLELLMAMTIFGTITAAVMALFLQASAAEADMNVRFQAQQAARVAVDRMRREIHCADQITPSGASGSIAVRLPAQCPTASGGITTVTYDLSGSGQRWALRRNSVVLADHVTIQNAFDYTTPVAGSSLGRLRVTLPIDTDPSGGAKEWRLVADIVLRNTKR